MDFEMGKTVVRHWNFVELKLFFSDLYICICVIRKICGKKPVKRVNLKHIYLLILLDCGVYAEHYKYWIHMMCIYNVKLRHIRECKHGSCILNVVLDRREWSTLHPSRFTRSEGALGGHWIGGRLESLCWSGFFGREKNILIMSRI